MMCVKMSGVVIIGGGLILGIVIAAVIAIVLVNKRKSASTSTSASGGATPTAGGTPPASTPPASSSSPPPPPASSPPPPASTPPAPQTSLNGRCAVVLDGYPMAGKTLCCPAGETAIGDGSACSGGCALYSNPEMPRCRHCVRIPGTDDVACCLNGQTAYGDGSACWNPLAGTACALYGNPEMPRCPSSDSCRVVPEGYEKPAGSVVCCPAGDVLIGDGSACSSGCALYSNTQMPRCTAQPDPVPR